MTGMSFSLWQGVHECRKYKQSSLPESPCYPSLLDILLDYKVATEFQRIHTWVQLFSNHDHHRGRGVAHGVMRNVPVQYNHLSTQHTLENVKGTLRLWAVVYIPHMCSIVVQIHRWSAITPQIYCITKRMLILMLKTDRNYNFKSVWPHAKPLFVFSISTVSIHIQKPKNFLFGIQYFYSGLALWIKYCVTFDPCGFTLSFLPFLFPLVFTSLGDNSLIRSLSLCWDSFPLQGKMASIFFILLSSLPSCSWALSISYPACRPSLFCSFLFIADVQLCQTVLFQVF